MEQFSKGHLYRDIDGQSSSGTGYIHYSRGRGKGNAQGALGGRAEGEGEATSTRGRGRGRPRGRGGTGRGYGGSGYRPRPGLGSGGVGHGGWDRYGHGGDVKYLKSFDDDVLEQVDEFFAKKFTFTDNYNDWLLPDPSVMLKDDRFDVPKLLELKEELNKTKEKLDSKEIVSWHKHTNFTHRASTVIPKLRSEFQPPEMCTQAWAKLHEILWSFDIVPQKTFKYNSVHLCEAPGAFVASLNHFIKTHRTDCKWKWRAMTLNPYYEGNSLAALNDQDKLMSETLDHWYLGSDNSGDVTTWENVLGLREVVRGEMEEGVHLVTADGTVSVSDPGEQEAAIAQLLFCEALTALILLKASGSFILKTFTTLECPSVCLMYLLNCCFEEVHVFKPVTSRAGNSEHYLVCLRYKGRKVALTHGHLEKLKNAVGSESPEAALFPLATIPPSFITQLTNCAYKFVKWQIAAIEENLKLYDCMTRSEKQFILDSKMHTWDTFKSRYKLKSIPREKAVVQHIFLNGTQLCVSQPHGDLVFQGLERRNIRSFLARMELKRKPRSSEDETVSPPSKLPKLTLTEDTTRAVSHLLAMTGYESSLSSKPGDQSGDQGLFAVEMEPEEVHWIRGPTNEPISLQDMKTLDGQKITKVYNSRFCRPDVLQKLNAVSENAQIMQPNHKDEHDHIASFLLPGPAVAASQQPFFLNADAINFATLDHLVNFSGKSDDGHDLTFVDLAGAPSGFSHYICWKRQHSARGWGMVRVENPRLGPGPVIDQLAPWENFQVLGPHGGVDICENNSIKSLCAGIENYSPGGVQLVIGNVPMVPFGAQPAGYAENLIKQYFLAQCICACKVLRPGGSFICRVYELLTRFSAGLVYLMYRLFREVAILKPVTSSATSPERFLVCRGYQGCKAILTEMLLEVNSHLSDLKKNNEGKVDVLEILPVQLLFEEQFCHSLTLSNERVAIQMTRTITSFENHFLKPQELSVEESQELLTKGILEVLQIPEDPTQVS